SGDNGLTDPLVDDYLGTGQDIAIDFDPFITSIRLYVVDIDGGESVTIRAYNGTTQVDSMTKSAGNTGTGNGVSTEFFLSADAITRIVIDVTTQIGFSVDFITFTRPCEGDGCGRLIEISQESAPDADDFKDNVLGFLVAYPSISSAANFYAYNVPEGDSWNGQSLTPIADRSHLMIADTTDGLTLVVTHDRAIPDDPDGGKAEMKFRLENDPDGVTRTVEDDPASMEEGPYTGNPGGSLFTTQHHWSPCCTDGIALSGLDGPWVMFVEFTDTDNDPQTPTIQGMNEWVAYSADGTLIPLALEEDRRVRIRSLEFFLPQDLNQDGFVDLFDFALFAIHWLETPCVEPSLCGNTDFVPDGEVNLLDLRTLLEIWLSGY
ncbi:MAG: hypothetical protein KAS23_03600, partial [Anaerohalosphaera sp.]|nr:hypothetical protein [Anaerohalosphaera sp.]